jgi:adenosylmethionine-8-amino-7-oxononanoate aminotransferase
MFTSRTSETNFVRYPNTAVPARRRVGSMPARPGGGRRRGVTGMATQVSYDTSTIMVDFNQMKTFGQDPLILERGEGIRVTDVFGKTYIDGLSGVFTVNLGHGIAKFADIAAEQMRKISFTAPTMATNPPALRLADLLISITPPQNSTVKFFTGGSEANESAIKLARQYHAQTGHPRKY